MARALCRAPYAGAMHQDKLAAAPLRHRVRALQQQQSADVQSQALALGKTTDIAGVTMAVERANLAMQLAVQVRNKAVDAYHEIFRMQI